MRKRPAFSFIVPHTLDQCIQLLEKQYSRQETDLFGRQYFWRINIQRSDDKYERHAEFIADIARVNNGNDRYGLFSVVIGTLESLGEHGNVTHIQLYRMRNWFLDIVIGLCFLPIVMWIAIFTLSMRASSSIATESLMFVFSMCMIVIVPLGIWTAYLLNDENRYVFRQFAERLGYKRQGIPIIRNLWQPIERFIEQRSTLHLLVPLSMDECLRRLNNLRNVSKNDPTIQQMVVSCPRQADEQTQVVTFQVRRKSKGSMKHFGRVQGTVERIKGFEDRMSVQAKVTRPHTARLKLSYELLAGGLIIMFAVILVAIFGSVFLGKWFGVVLTFSGAIAVCFLIWRLFFFERNQLINTLENALLFHKHKNR